MKIAQYKNVAYDFECVSDDGLATCKDYVRLSEWVDVDFPPIPREETVKAELAILEEEANEIRAETQQRLNEIERRKQELLALPSV